MTAHAPRGIAAITVAGVRLSGRGWGFLGTSIALFFAAYVGGRQELVFVAALVGALPVFAVIMVCVRRPRLAVTRAFSPHVIPAGTVASVSLVARNLATSASARATWWDAVPWRPFTTADADLPTLLARGARFAGRGNAVGMSYELRPPRRGNFPIGPLTVQVADVFGLATSTFVTGAPQSIVVTPEVIPLSDTGLSVPSGDGESRLVQRRATGDEDDAMTREYRDGDAMRRVHWRASARKGDLMVRQEEQRSFPEARVIVETRRTGYRDVSTDTDDGDVQSAAFEWSVRMLAAVAVHLRRTGFLVSIEETGAPQLDSVSRGTRRTWADEEFLVSLASLSLTEGHESLPSRDRSSNGPIFAILGSLEPEVLDWLVPQRRPGELAVAFMARSLSGNDHIDKSVGMPTIAPAIGQRLVDAGWLVVPVRADDDHAAAWEAVVVEMGRSRGTA
jgi:hypothetical protein